VGEAMTVSEPWRTMGHVDSSAHTQDVIQSAKADPRSEIRCCGSWDSFPRSTHTPSLQYNLSGHRKKMTERGVLMNWIPQRERLVRMWKESDQARVTHKLRTTDGGTCQDIERKRPSQYPRRRDMSGHK